MNDLNTSYLWFLKKQIYSKKGISFNYYNLDNAATVYSLFNKKKMPGLFRLEVTLIEDIKLDVLQSAFEQIIFRFPYFNVNLKPGIFWPFWETNYTTPKIQEDTKYPCRKHKIFKSGNLPFKVLHHKKKIAVEFHHTVTDGTGALIFLKSLLSLYFEKLGIKSEKTEEIFKPNAIAHPEEFEDAYKRYFKPNLPLLKNETKAFQPPLEYNKDHAYHLNKIKINVQELLKITREKKVTITEFITAQYIDALQDIYFDLDIYEQRRLSNPIRVPIPINLRKFFPSKTMRNFSYVVSTEIDPRIGKHSFDEILNQVHHQMQLKINNKKICQAISRNVKIEKFPLMYGLPLPIKMMFGGLIHKQFGEKRYSGKISNLGIARMPEELSRQIDNFQFILCPSCVLKSGIGIISFNNKLILNIGRTSKEKVIQENFLSSLDEQHIPFEIIN